MEMHSGGGGGAAAALRIIGPDTNFRKEDDRRFHASDAVEVEWRIMTNPLGNKMGDGRCLFS